MDSVNDENQNHGKHCKDLNNKYERSPLQEANNIELVTEDVQFHTEPANTWNESKKRKRLSEEQDENISEEDEKKIHEQRYKRLLHLLNQSKFYAKYISDKVEKGVERKQSNNTDEDTTKKEKGSDIVKYTTKEKKKFVEGKLNLSNEEIEEELCNDIEFQTSLSVSTNIPKYFVGDLRNYQIDGLQWLKVLYENGINGILADEMGLGKTIQIIAFICHLIEKRQNGPYLIVAPLSTIANWRMEFEKFAPKLPVIILHGKKEERRALYSKIIKKYLVDDNYKTQPIVITSFEIPLHESSFLISQKWRYIIVDEGQRIKNHECLLISVLKRISSMNRLILTGTPLQNDLSELWALLNFLMPEIFNDLAVFESWFSASDVQNDEGAKKFLKQEEEKRVIYLLREILKPFMLRRDKSDVCLDIPPKKELVVYTPLTQIQYDLYKAVLNRDIDTLTKIKPEDPIIHDIDGEKVRRKCFLRSKYGNSNMNETIPSSSASIVNEQENSISSNNLKNTSNDGKHKHLSIWKQYTEVTERNMCYFIRLTLLQRSSMYKKIVNHPYLIHRPLDVSGLPQIDNNLIKSSGKLLVLDAMLTKLKKQGHKVILFSTMTTILDILEDYLSLKDYKYLRLDGATPIEIRIRNITDFNSNPEIFLFLISTRAGGVGLNLTGADTAIIYDSDWNPQVDIQAMARCHRIGQTRPVVIYRLCTKGTIDEKIINRADAKRILEKMVMSKKLQNNIDKTTLLYMKQLFDSKEYEIVKSNQAVFTEAELERLLDRSDLIQKMQNFSKNE